MRKSLLIFLLFATANAGAQIPISGFEPADDLVVNLINKRWKSALKEGTKDVKSALSPSELKEAWENLENELGEFERISSVDTQHSEAGFIATYRFLFERSSLNLVVTVNHSNRIGSLVFIPLTYQVPDRFNGKPINVERIVVKTDTFRMPGELMLPNNCNHCPLVVLVHGSGPSDRDVSIGPNKIFKDLAIFLAEKGIATFRYDKRTYVYPDLYEEQRDSLTVNGITVDDAISAIRVARNHPMTDSSPVFVLGHSLGGLMAPKIAANDNSVQGVIIAAGPTTPLHYLIRKQLTFLFAKDNRNKWKKRQMLRKVDKAVHALDEGNYTSKHIKNLGPWGPAFWKDILQCDPVSTTARSGIPTLVLFGKRDYQVSPDQHAPAWDEVADSSDDVLVRVYPGLNHLFLYGKGEPNRGEYLNPGHFSEEVVGDVVDWILDFEF